MQTLVTQALADTSLVKTDVIDTIEEMIARLDEKLSAQMNEILHAPEFQQLESAWRGLNYLVFNSETDATLKIRVLNVGKMELYRNFKSNPGARWDQSPLFKAVYESEFGNIGRRTLRRAGRRLSLQPSGGRRPGSARSVEDRLGGAGAADHRRRPPTSADGFVDAN